MDEKKVNQELLVAMRRLIGQIDKASFVDEHDHLLENNIAVELCREAIAHADELAKEQPIPQGESAASSAESRNNNWRSRYRENFYHRMASDCISPITYGQIDIFISREITAAKSEGRREFIKQFCADCLRSQDCLHRCDICPMNKYTAEVKK